MKTPKTYQQLLLQGVLDEQMMGDVIFSFNKRAKNFRDKSEEYRYRYRYDKYNNVGRAQAEMREYYRKKDALLRLFPDKVVCIHKHTIQKRIDEYVYKDVDNYYLYIELGDKSFHSPIKNIKALLKNEKFQHLEIIDLPDDFYTHGEDISSLLSVQFCNKVYEKFISENREYKQAV